MELCTVEYRYLFGLEGGRINSTNPPYTIACMAQCYIELLPSSFIIIRRNVALERFCGYKSIRENCKSFLPQTNCIIQYAVYLIYKINLNAALCRFSIGYNTFTQATTAFSHDVTAIKDNCILESLHETGLLKHPGLNALLQYIITWSY